MADALGILGFALHAAHKIYDVLEIIKDASDDIKALQKEAYRVRGILPPLLETIQTDGKHQEAAYNSQLLALLDEAQTLNEAIEKFLAKTTTKKGDNSLSVKRLKWIFYAAEGKDLTTKFKNFYLSLCAVYTVMTHNTMATTPAELQQLQETMNSAYRSFAEQQEAQLNQTTVRIRAMVEFSLQAATMRQRRGYDRIADDPGSYRVRNVTATVLEQSIISPALEEDSSGDSNVRQIEGVEEAAEQLSALVVDNRLEQTRMLQDLSVVGPPSIVQPCGISDLLRCPSQCRCRCHSLPLLRPIPRWLAPYIGDVCLPRTLLAALCSFLNPCDDPVCVQTQQSLYIIKLFLPTWFAEVDAHIRLKSLPIHFCIQTPRVVESLDFLNDATIEDVKILLSERRMTLNDVEPDGGSVLHKMMWRAVFDGEVTYPILDYILNVGIPQDWTYNGLTPAEFALWQYQLWWLGFTSRTQAVQSFQYNIAGPCFNQDMDEARDSLRIKAGWTDIHTLFLGLTNPIISLDALNSMLRLPRMASEVNRRDLWGWTPLYYAIWTDPEAAEALLRAGANPRMIPAVSHAASAGASAAIGPLIRAGAGVNGRHGFRRSTALHRTAFGPAHKSDHDYRSAVELVRHGGHALQWDTKDRYGRTPLDIARERLEHSPDDVDSRRLFELYKTRTISEDEKYVDPMLLAESIDHMEFPPSPSLIEAGLRGDHVAIGDLITVGVMVNERDINGRTLLHLAAIGEISNPYAVAIELTRYGGYGVHWDALTPEGKTALQLAEERLHPDNMTPQQRNEMHNILALLRERRLPRGKRYVYPCMDPDYCYKCSMLDCPCMDLDIPGDWRETPQMHEFPTWLEASAWSSIITDTSS